MATRNGTNGNDELIGTPQADDFRGFDGDDRLIGLAGNDLMRGGDGEDRLEGGAGSDTADYEYVTGEEFFGVELDLESGGAGVSGDDRDALTSIENAAGSRFSDGLYGDDAANVLQGAASGDRLGGRGGADTLDGGAGGDDLSGGAGDDRILGGSGSDTAYFLDASRVTVDLVTGVATGGDGRDRVEGVESVFANDGNDVISGTEGANFLQGNGGSDELRGRGGDDVVEAGAISESRLFGGGGDDRLGTGFGNDVVDGGSGNDTVFFSYEGRGPDDDGDGIPSSGDFVPVLGGVEVFLDRGFARTSNGRTELSNVENADTPSEEATDVLVGDDQANVLDSGAGRDTLNGNGGDDRLIGNEGGDDLTGGAGRDVFDFDAAQSIELRPGQRERVRDFEDGDRLDFTGLDGNLDNMSSDDAFDFVGRTPFSEAGQLRYTTGDGGAVVQGSVDGDTAAELEIRLDGVSALQGNDFVL